MIETKDPAIKLFGKTIPLPADGDDSVTASGTGDCCEVMDCDYATTTTCPDEEKKGSRVEEEEEEEEEEETEKDILAVKSTEAKQLDDGDESEKAETLLETNDNPKTPSIDEETAMIKPSKTGKEQSDKSNSQEKPLKKPDKILPCPRCNSMDTKFCYYNNYNINQPRHFCKACQRYWTAGGTMRNVPVGAGRRKNKNSASQYRHITISEALQAARIEAPNGVHHALKSNGTVLNFGSDSCLSESIASVLNLTDKKPFWNGTPNGYHKIEEQRIPVPCRVGESGDDHSSGSSVTALNSMEEGNRTCAQEPMMSNFHGFPSQIPCLPGVPWPYPWNSAIPPPAFCHPGFPMPFYPPSYWNCTIPNTWNVPWLSPQSSPNQKSQSSSSNSPTLGKHPRDENMLKADNQEEEGLPKQKSADRCIWVPKTLRIDDPDEAAKSSIWATLGIKNDTIKGKGLFKAFQSKGDEKNHVSENSAVLRANPAALSRSLNFHENS